MPAIVLDDGSHIQGHVNSAFNFLYPQLQPDGIYAVEDLHTAYWPDHQGGLHAPTSFIERCKSLIDELNGVWTPEKSLLTPFTRSTISMSFYDSVVVFEKGRLPPLMALESEKGIIKSGFSR